MNARGAAVLGCQAGLEVHQMKRADESIWRECQVIIIGRTCRPR
jgi:hypothetical protein